jgi:hypothetical protein
LIVVVSIVVVEVVVRFEVVEIRPVVVVIIIRTSRLGADHGIGWRPRADH